MAKENKKKDSEFNCSDIGNCKIEALLSIDERGQMVIPKDIRDKAGIKPGDKLAAISWEREGEVICISLIKADNFIGMIKGFLSPFFNDFLKKSGE